MGGEVAFDTTLEAFGNNTGIVVPVAVLERLAAGRRPPVAVEVNGYRYRTTVGVMGGKHLISVSAAVRRETGLAGGDPVHVVVSHAPEPRDVGVPDDFAQALAAAPGAAEFFAALSNSLQRYHVDAIEGAKSPDTRRRRIDKAVALFRAGKKR